MPLGRDAVTCHSQRVGGPRLTGRSDRVAAHPVKSSWRARVSVRHSTANAWAASPYRDLWGNRMAPSCPLVARSHGGRRTDPRANSAWPCRSDAKFAVDAPGDVPRTGLGARVQWVVLPVSSFHDGLGADGRRWMARPLADSWKGRACVASRLLANQAPERFATTCANYARAQAGPPPPRYGQIGRRGLRR